MRTSIKIGFSRVMRFDHFLLHPQLKSNIEEERKKKKRTLGLSTTVVIVTHPYIHIYTFEH